MRSDPHQPTVPVARVITRLNIGGPSIQAVRLTTALNDYGFAGELFHGRLGTGEGDMSYLIPPGARTTFIATLCRPLSPLDDARTLLRLYREFRRVRPQVIHTHMAKAGLLGRLAAAAYNLTRGRAPRARVVHTYHGHVLDGYFSPFMTAVFIGLERLLARISDAIIAISPAIRTDLLHTYRIGKDAQYRVVPLGFDLAPFAAVDATGRSEARRSLEVPPGVPVVTTVGRLTAIKQHHLFLDLVQRLAADHPTLVALIAGDGEMRAELEAAVQQRGIARHVRFLGWRRDLATIYAATDVFLLTSRNEGTPVALIEAMATGVPGVSTDVGGVRDVITSDAVGLLAPFDDAAGLAAAAHRLLADPALRAAMGTRARSEVLARFGVERLVADIAGVYRGLDAGSRMVG